MARTSNIYYSEMDTLIGSITLARTKKGLCWLGFNQGETVLKGLEIWSRRHFLTQQMQRDDAALEEIKIQLDEYFRGARKNFECELDLVGTTFQKLVWNTLCDIPYGEVRTYKDIAQAIKAPKAVRAVGGANNKNNIAIIVPCHRVIGSNGALVGYGGGIHIKEQLLRLEGFEKGFYRKKA